jgi:hypothetical protein
MGRRGRYKGIPTSDRENYEREKHGFRIINVENDVQGRDTR